MAVLSAQSVWPLGRAGKAGGHVFHVQRSLVLGPAVWGLSKPAGTEAKESVTTSQSLLSPPHCTCTHALAQELRETHVI